MAKLKSGTRIYGNATVDSNLTVTSGPVLVGLAISTGTASQPLQVSGGAYVSGSVGIGTTIPTTNLHVVGGALITGVTTSTDFNSTSDLNLKTNIQPIENAIDKILQMNGVTFNWKVDNRSSVGVIAQDIEKVFPELVQGENPKTVNYNGIIGLLIEAIKEQHREINSLKEKLK